ncbi:MAG: nucleoside monophosphate kinase [bacterium]
MKASKKQYNFLVAGPQGSGKGTQAELLAEKFNLNYAGAGQMLRQAAKQKTAFGRKVALATKQGKLVPSAWVVALAKKEIKQTAQNQGLVFDGFARLLPEAKALQKMLGKINRPITAVFLIDISTKETIKRLSKRRQCANGHLFISGKTLKKIRKTCPQCGAKIFQREDDQPKAIQERLKNYHQKTKPALDYFKKQGLLIKINGQQPVKKVFSDILKVIKKFS